MEQVKRILDERIFGLGNSDGLTEERWEAVTVPQAEKMPWVLAGIALLGIIVTAYTIKKRRR